MNTITDRRTFLKTAGLSSFALTLTRPLQALPSDSRYMKNIGLQLWTVRNQLDKNIPSTLKAVADAGYAQVELMSTLDADKYLLIAENLGMKVTSAFIDWRAIGQADAADVPSFDDILEKAESIGLKHLVFGYIGKGERETADHFKRHADRANAAGQKCRTAGIQLCYHNHSFEFGSLPNGQKGFDIFTERFDKELMKFEVDVFWVAIGGRDPIKTIRQLSGRVSQVHLKDLLKGTAVNHDEGTVKPEAFKELGNGIINMASVIEASEAAGAEQCHVEQDASPNPLHSIGESIRYLRML